MNASEGTPPVLGYWDRLKASVPSLTRAERRTWVLALLLFVVGDMATTAVGLQLGAIELNPGGVWLLETLGVLPGMVVGKAAVLGVTWAFYSRMATFHRIAIPATIAALGAAIVGMNGYVVLVLTGVL